jgi:hypothetical protein
MTYAKKSASGVFGSHGIKVYVLSGTEVVSKIRDLRR